MFRCWSPVYGKEENSLPYDDFDLLKEWLVDPDRVQLQNPSDFSNTSLDPHGLHFSGVKIEQKDQILESSIDVKMEKVSLAEISDGGQGEMGLEENGGGNDGDMKCVKPGFEALKSDLPNKEGNFERESDEGSTSVEAESDSGDSSSDESSSDESMSVAKSVSSSEDEDDGGMAGKEEAEEFEEGEVREFDAHVIDFANDEEGEGPKRPISSKHEVEDLPPVPMVEVSLQSHHKMLPVGIISSIMSNRVIVEGSVRHNPLDEGSILWFTDTRLPLGQVDETFGPVKNPYYVVRYNTEVEVPAGVEVGIAISFVAEFASRILNDKELYKKGYDASGENDEEVDNEVEFSDDEKETEYKKSLRQGKRVTNDWKGVKQHEARFERKKTTFMGPRVQQKDIQKQPTCAPLSMDQHEARFERKKTTFTGPRVQQKDIQKQPTCAPLFRDQRHPTDLVPPQPAALVGQSGIGPGSWNSSSGANAVSIPPPPMPQFPQAMHAVNFLGNPSQQLITQHQDTPWLPGFSPQLQNTGLQGDLPMQLQNQNIFLNNLVNMIALQQLLQQCVPHQGSTLPLVGAAPSLQPLGQNNFAPSPFGNGFINAPGTPGLGNEQVLGQPPLPVAPSMQFNAGSSSSLHFNGGNSRSHGRRPYQRGGGHFFGRGGRQPNR